MDFSNNFWLSGSDGGITYEENGKAWKKKI